MIPLKILWSRSFWCFLLLGTFFFSSTAVQGQFPVRVTSKQDPVERIFSRQNRGTIQHQEPKQMEPRKKKRRKSSSESDEKKTKEKKYLFEEKFMTAGKSEPIRIDHDNYRTVDDVFLVGEFYKGNADKETIPVILLHGQDSQEDQTSSKKDMERLAVALSEMGFAVLVPDLRGFGESTRRLVEDNSYGDRSVEREDEEYLASDFTVNDYRAMGEYDGMFWYRFLLSQNNQERLNLRRLVIVGADLGATIAVIWAKNDWSIPGTKKGKFTRVIVLMSPKKECLTVLESFKKGRPSEQLGYLGFVGSLSKLSFEEMKKIQNRIGGRQSADTPSEKRRFPVYSFKTEKQGTELLTVQSFDIPNLIKNYIDSRMEKPAMKNLQWQVINLEED